MKRSVCKSSASGGALLVALLLGGCGARTLDAADAARTDAAPPSSVDTRAPADGRADASAVDLPAWRDATPDVADPQTMPRVSAPPTADLKAAKPITAQSAQALLWAHQARGGGKYPEVSAWFASAGTSRAIALINANEPLTIAGTTLGKSVSAQNAREVHVVELDASGVTRWLTIARGTSPRCDVAVNVDQDLLVYCHSSKQLTLLPDQPSARVVPASAKQGASFGVLARLGWQADLHYSRRIEGAEVRGVRADSGRDVVVYGAFYQQINAPAPLLMRATAPPKSFYVGSGFMIRLDRKTGALLAASQIDGDASSAIGDVVLRADGSAFACGVAGGYSSNGRAVATFNPGSADELPFVSFTGGDPSGVAFTARFDRSGDRDVARWVRAGYGYLDTSGRCDLHLASSKHVALGVSGGSSLGFSGGASLLATAASPVVIYQDNGVPVSGASVALTMNNTHSYGIGGRLLDRRSVKLSMYGGRSLYFNAYQSPPRALVLPEPPADRRHGLLHIVAEIDWQARLTALRWGLQLSVAKPTSAPRTRFTRLASDSGAVVGAIYGPGSVGGLVTVGKAGERRLFFVAARLARGAL